MVHYCCVPECKASGFEENVSFHSFPKEKVRPKNVQGKNLLLNNFKTCG